MGLYSPPDGSKNPNLPQLTHKEDPGKPNDEKAIQFYPRPSLGLRLWGPLVPASDNRTGLWTLVGVQTGIGLLCFQRFRTLGSRIMKRDISEFPSLNRFSTTRGDIYMGAHVGTSFGGTHSFRRVGHAGSNGFFQSARFNTFKRTMYLLSGSLLLSQSLLEACRLTILKYDPWYEEAHSAREKQFFNDIVRYYHEGIDPTRFKVKDAVNGNVLPLNTPEVKQSVAFARATVDADSWLISWFGPLEYKPMSFTEYLDRLEYHLEMTDFIRNRHSKDATTQLLGRAVTHKKQEYDELMKKNAQTRQNVHSFMESAPKHSIPVTNSPRQSSLKGTILDSSLQDPQDIDLAETWTTFNPWLDLALETSLSIKFLPTVLMSDESQAEQNTQLADETQTENNAHLTERGEMSGSGASGANGSDR
ncbi:LAME_0G00914g1_1 [Lachancea meyersii CBS 8951]|uniref:LAME_0G00914g1_1 n=1 Tax=Lachancea meyersii CBS 8951 TaxID=1266667 RepID=A0A1G4K559_9SACH|nr:LAME_0G00914g1_1 [Lachancea meyersii CBS 8951]